MLEILRYAHVAVLTLDRPRRRNALGSDLISALRSAFRDVEVDDGVQAVILTGSPPGFCAGSDLKELSGVDVGEMCRHEQETGLLVRSIPLLSKPVIAAVEGFALGGGFVLATCCDIVVTAKCCRWHLPEVKLGWLPPWGQESLLARCTPSVARQLVLGIEPIDGCEALRLGIADYLAPENDVLTEALVLAHKLAALPRPAVGAVKRYFAMTRQEGRGDSEANRMFAEHCAHDSAKASLRKYGVEL
jgi:enoyl-CoA hydratase/carnithine racemase